MNAPSDDTSHPANVPTDGGPAFPVSLNDSGAMYSEGMSLLAYFAAHAPQEIPHWFAHINPVQRPSRPAAADLPEQYQQQAVRWIDGDYDMPADVPELVEFQRSWRAASEAVDLWRDNDNANRYFQWRWHYAAMMLRMRPNV